MKEMFNQIPGPLRKVILLRLAASFAAILMLICVLLFQGEWQFAVPCIAAAIVFFIAGLQLLADCSEKKYIAMQFCRSLESGVITMNNDVVRRVGALHDMQIEDEHINAVLCGKETILPEEVKQTIREAAEQHAKDILDKLRELKVDLRSNPAYFIGGGSILYREYLDRSPLVAKAYYVENPNANAVGYHTMAEAQLAISR